MILTEKENTIEMKRNIMVIGKMGKWETSLEKKCVLINQGNQEKGFWENRKRVKQMENELEGEGVVTYECKIIFLDFLFFYL